MTEGFFAFEIEIKIIFLTMASRTSHAQFLVMVEFMEKYGDLSKPQSLPQGRQWSIKKWKELSELLNSQGTGESRSGEKWRKVWSDLKNNTKRKWAKMNRSVKGTGGGPALKMYLTDIENRVLSIIGVQAAVGMPLAEVGFGLVEESVDTDKTIEPQTDNLLFSLPESPIDDEDWNTPGSSKDPGPMPEMLRSFTPARSSSPLKSTTKSPSPPKSPIGIHRQTFPQPPPPPPPPQHQRKRTLGKLFEDYVIKCDANAREDNRERERLFVYLERERIRQRDTELQLQAQWLEIMKAALNVIEKYLSGASKE